MWLVRVVSGSGRGERGVTSWFMAHCRASIMRNCDVLSRPSLAGPQLARTPANALIYRLP